MPSCVITVRHAEPSGFNAFHKIFSQPGAVSGAAQLPFPSAESWRKKLENPPPGFCNLVACADDEVVGTWGFTRPPTLCRRHVGSIGMAVRDDWQNKGVGSALMQAVLELADR